LIVVHQKKVLKDVVVCFKLRRNDRKDNDEDNYLKGRLYSRAAKAKGKKRDWWNVEDMVTGDIRAMDLSKVTELRIIDDLADDKDKHKSVYITTTIPAEDNTKTQKVIPQELTTISKGGFKNGLIEDRNEDKKGSQSMDCINQALMITDECGRGCERFVGRSTLRFLYVPGSKIFYRTKASIGRLFGRIA
jgi:hypothetical protein